MISVPLKEKITKLACRGFLVISSKFFCYNQVGLLVVWYFDKYIILLKKKKKKTLMHVPAYGPPSRFSDDA